MIRLFYSNRTEALLQRLAENVSTQRAQDGVWEPIHILVPNAQVEAYLGQGLAHALGIAANLKFRFLDGLYRFSLPDQEPPLRMLDRGTYQGTLLASFQDPAFLEHEALAPLRTYLQGDVAGPRAVQLALELARLFEEYTLSRPEWMRAWSLDRDAGTGGPIALEAWQRRLWRHCRGQMATTSTSWISLPEYLDSGLVAQTAFPSAIHLFGLSHVSQAYHQAFQRIGEVTQLLIYTLNPCAEFWDDLETQRRVPVDSLFADETEESPRDGDPRALKLWGRPGREHIRLLNAAAEYDFESDFVECPGETLLQRLQEEIRQRREAPLESGVGADGSVQILVCPSARREAEAVADRIWEALEAHREEDEPLRFSEIAIIVPAAQRSSCAAHLRAAFEAAHGIPLTELDGPGPRLASLVEAAGLMLQLPLSALDRRSVLEVLTHPALQEARPELDTEHWSSWCEAAGIVRGADATELAGTYVEHDLLNWDQGLARMGLGTFLPEELPLNLEGERYWPTAGSEGMATFVSLLRRLLTDIQRMRVLRSDPSTWARILAEFLEQYLGSPEEARTRDLQKLLKALTRMEALVPEGLPGANLDYAGAVELAKAALERVLSESSGTLARGVVLSSYLPMRAIPFKVIFLMGLGEGLFPARDSANPLDLRAFRRRMGDASPAERDRYLFLEMLLCARERFILSYVARDAVSGEALEPSPLLRELGEIADLHLDLPEREKVRVQVPFHRREDPASRASGARKEAQAASWGRKWRELAGPAPRLEQLAPLARQRLETLLAPIKMPYAPPVEGLSVSFAQLRKWLECPLQGGAILRLGLRALMEEEASQVEEEPFESGALEGRQLRRRALWESLRQGCELEDSYRRLRERQTYQGVLALGLLGEEESLRHLETLRIWEELLRGGAPRMHRFGEAPEGELPPDFLHPALTLEVPFKSGTRAVELAGFTQPQWRVGSLVLSERRGSDPAMESGRLTLREQKECLKGYLDQVLLAASGLQVEAHRVWICVAGSEKQRGLATLGFPPLDAGVARELLQSWLREAFEDVHPWAIPIEAVLEDAEELSEWMRDKHEQNRGFSSAYGPISRPQDHLPPGDLDWKGLVRGRLGGFLAALAEERTP